MVQKSCASESRKSISSQGWLQAATEDTLSPPMSVEFAFRPVSLNLSFPRLQSDAHSVSRHWHRAGATAQGGFRKGIMASEQSLWKKIPENTFLNFWLSELPRSQPGDAPRAAPRGFLSQHDLEAQSKQGQSSSSEEELPSCWGWGVGVTLPTAVSFSLGSLGALKPDPSELHHTSTPWWPPLVSLCHPEGHSQVCH